MVHVPASDTLTANTIQVATSHTIGAAISTLAANSIASGHDSGARATLVTAGATSAASAAATSHLPLERRTLDIGELDGERLTVIKENSSSTSMANASSTPKLSARPIRVPLIGDSDERVDSD